MTDDGFHLLVEFPLALQISAILCHSSRNQQLDHLMEAFRPYLKEMYAQHRRNKIRRVK